MKARGLALTVAFVLAACATPQRPPAPAPVPAPAPAPEALRVMRVTATAFNSVVSQTDGHPHLTASGRVLRPGVRALAVSRDLEAAGLTFGTRVEIDGYGEWIVLDRMAARWKRKVDLYMGLDESAARRFGRRQVKIRWRPD